MSDVVLMDGGMGQELVARTKHPLHPLWSAMVMLQEPEIVREVHLDYIEAGAKILTVNTYSATPERLARSGIAERFDELQAIGCRLAEEAREEAGIDGVRLAGCLPPLVGSYRPDRTPPDAAAAESYARIAAAQAPHVDLFICETMASAREARLAASAARATGKPVWVALTLADGGSDRLRSGESVAEALAALKGIGVEAVLANCCYPESVTAAAAHLAASGLPWGAYPNAFTGIEKLVPGGTVAELTARSDLGPERFTEISMGWRDRGARLLGGCCEVGPAHIAALADALGRAGHRVTGGL